MHFQAIDHLTDFLAFFLPALLARGHVIPVFLIPVHADICWGKIVSHKMGRILNLHLAK